MQSLTRATTRRMRPLQPTHARSWIVGAEMLSGVAQGDLPGSANVEGHVMRRSTEYTEPLLDLAIDRFRDGVVAAPISAERAVLCSYLQDHIDDIRQTFTLLAEDLDPAAYAKCKARCADLLHPTLKESPFLCRALEKPLGYAGDFEMMNMLYRDPWEGRTPLGRALNVCFTNEPAAVANKNRIAYLGELIREKSGQNRVRIASIGCGPAKEIEELLRESPELGPRLDITLVDQEQLALDQCSRTIPSARLCRAGLRQPLTDQAVLPEGSFDLIYSAGMFDYLGPRLFEAVSRGLFRALAPGAELVIGNVAAHSPSRWIMEYFADWCLIHRTSKELSEFGARWGATTSWVDAEPSGINLFLHAVKEV
jgi:extracellular factor (EF) 3-hydroxypalmitic acid methyl ester biosynthesis protein